MYRCIFPALLCFTSVFATEYGDELYNSGWQINTDNDLLTGQSTDRDYTGGIALTLSGKRVQQYPLSIDGWRAGIDEWTNFPSLYQSSEYLSFHSQQYGMILFTPDDIDSKAPVHNDRPYASLFFMSNSEFTVVPEKKRAYVSILTIGILGLNVAESVQRSLHSITDSTVPSGWQNQVSAGGEPTAMLTYGVQDKFYASGNQQLKFEYEGNLGYITDVNAGFSWRWGRISSPWWTFNPYQSKYMQQAMPMFSGSDGGKDELYLWAGGRLNLRLYNALLQGQFRHSEVTISSAEMQRLVAEYWLGVTAGFARKYRASIFLRGHTDEFNGQNARDAAWVGLVFSRVY
jgi:hypothetical protein